MKILVTGGLGFIGSHLVDYWFKTHPSVQVIIYDAFTYAADLFFLEEAKKRYQERLVVIKGSTVDKQTLSKAVEAVEFVYQLAAETHVGKSNYQAESFINTNILGTYHLLEIIKETGKKVIFASSAEVYGSLHVHEPFFSENALKRPQSIYAVTKCTGEDLIYCMHYLYGINATIVRLFNNYGPRQHFEKVIPRFIKRAFDDLPLEIEGDGTATRDWLYVEDTCAALYKLAFREFSRLETINLAACEEHSILEIAHLILEYTGKPKNRIRFIQEREGNVHKHVAANDKMKALLGVHFEFDFQKRLKQLVGWYQENPHYLQSSDTSKSKMECIEG